MGGTILFLIIAGALVALIVIPNISYFGTKQVTIQPISKFIDPGKEKSYYLVENKDHTFIELDRPWWDFSHNIDKLYQQVDGHIKNNETVTYECFAWDNQGLHWYYNCYEELNVVKTKQ